MVDSTPDDTEDTGTRSSRGLSRRRIVRATGGLAVMTVALGSATRGDHGDYRALSDDVGLTAAPRSLSARERAMILRIAKAGAGYPIAFPEFGERGPALHRATAGRLAVVEQKVSAARRALVRKGAQQLLSAGLVDADRATLVHGIGQKVLHARKQHPPQPLVAAVAIAIATVSRHFDPNSDDAARMWLDFTRNLVLVEKRRKAEGH
jgi:hypothetical protein